MTRFEIVSNELRLKAGETLDFETDPILDVTVERIHGSIDTPMFGTTTFDSESDARRSPRAVR